MLDARQCTSEKQGVGEIASRIPITAIISNGLPLYQGMMDPSYESIPWLVWLTSSLSKTFTYPFADSSVVMASGTSLPIRVCTIPAGTLINTIVIVGHQGRLTMDSCDGNTERLEEECPLTNQTVCPRSNRQLTLDAGVISLTWSLRTQRSRYARIPFACCILPTLAGY